MNPNNDEWEARVAETWSTFDAYEPDVFIARVELLASQLPAADPRAAFERACALDSTGHSGRAVPLYREALDLGLGGIRRRRAAIQMASSLRNLGKSEEAAAILRAELDRPSDELDDAVKAFYALALADLYQEREGLVLALTALAPHLPRYQRSVKNYASELLRDSLP